MSVGKQSLCWEVVGGACNDVRHLENHKQSRMLGWTATGLKGQKVYETPRFNWSSYLLIMEVSSCKRTKNSR